MSPALPPVLKRLAKASWLTLSIVVTLALGIGATTAAFDFADIVLFRPLPYPHFELLVFVRDELSKMGVHFNGVTNATFEAYQKCSCFERTALFTEGNRNLTRAGTAERVSVLSSTPGLSEMLAAQILLGRTFSKLDGTPQHDGVAILSYSLFARDFGANPDEVSRSIQLNDRLYTVIGVMAPDSKIGINAKSEDVWVPLLPLADPLVWQYRMLAKLRPGLSLQAAQLAILEVTKRVEETGRPYRGPNGEDGGYTARLLTIRSQLYGDYRSASLVLSTATSLLLLIACINVANLLLARATAREKETIMRRALGASNWGLLRLWAAETAVLVGLGGVAGFYISHLGVLLLQAISPTNLLVKSMDANVRVPLFTLLLCSVVCLVLSAAPALAMPDTRLSLRGPQRTSQTTKFLVVAEVALAMGLVFGCSLLSKSLASLLRIDPGVRVDHLLTMQIQLSGARYKQPVKRVEFFSALEDRLTTLPGVVSASEVDRLPVFTVGADTRYGNPFSLVGRPFNPSAQTKQMAHTITMGLNYFRTIGIRLLRGRDFSRSDVLGGPPVAIVNATLERVFFPNRSAIGQHILVGQPTFGARWMTIIGVVSDVRNGALDLAPPPQLFTSQMQDPSDHMVVVVYTKEDASEMTRSVLKVERSMDPGQPASDVSTMARHLDDVVGQPRFRAVLTSLFGLIALALAAVGVYGVVAHSVAKRTREIGIRGALGATPMRIARMIIAEGMRPILAGILLGCGLGAVFARFLASILFQVQPYDPGSFVFSMVSIGMIGAAACLIPALSAVRVDPAVTLREE